MAISTVAAVDSSRLPSLVVHPFLYIQYDESAKADTVRDPVILNALRDTLQNNLRRLMNPYVDIVCGNGDPDCLAANAANYEVTPSIVIGYYGTDLKIEMANKDQTNSGRGFIRIQSPKQIASYIPAAVLNLLVSLDSVPGEPDFKQQTQISERKGMVQIPGNCPENGQPGKGCVKGFLMDQVEVQAGIYAKNMRIDRLPNNIIGMKSKGPVRYTGPSSYGEYGSVSLSYQDAKAYCTVVGKRLPTDAEWLWASRGPYKTRYFWGDDSARADLYAWSANREPHQIDIVGLRPGPWGLWNMSGNLWEWTEERSIRGGSYQTPASQMTPELQMKDVVLGMTPPNVGVRCVVSEP